MNEIDEEGGRVILERNASWVVKMIFFPSFLPCFLPCFLPSFLCPSLPSSLPPFFPFFSIFFLSLLFFPPFLI
jgi:hypothetical protein